MGTDFLSFLISTGVKMYWHFIDRNILLEELGSDLRFDLEAIGMKIKLS